MRLAKSCTNSFHPGDTSGVLETATVIARFGLLLFLSLETHQSRLLLAHLGALPSVHLVWKDQLARTLVLHLGTLDICQDFSLNPSIE